MLQIIGWIGLGLVVFSFILLATNHSKYFIITNIIATLSLLVHSIIIKDFPFILVQMFIVIALIVKQIKGGIK